MSEGRERTKSPEELMSEQLLLQIPSDPQKEEIVEILAKCPSIISYIQNILSELKNNISMKKMLVKREERELENLQSQHRMNSLTKYRAALKEALATEPERKKKLIELGYKDAEAKELLKLERPEKPTATDLKDVSILRTKDFHKTNIAPLEDEIQLLEKDYEMWKVRYNLFENNFKASQSIKGLIQQEMNNFGGNYSK